ncbi:MAG: nuclear transport factor 2 family protein [Betaproteobacteria bacterium]
MMHPHAELLTGFYAAFAAKDGNAMAAAYHPDAQFSDPVFTDLRGAEVGAMWKMLCARATDLRLEARDISASEGSGQAHWEAWYTFTRTGRPVHNVIDATFEFKNGKIFLHRDSFDFWRWSRMALGPAGTLMGWTPVIRNAVRKEARAGLKKFMGRPAD